MFALSLLLVYFWNYSFWTNSPTHAPSERFDSVLFNNSIHFNLLISPHEYTDSIYSDTITALLNYYIRWLVACCGIYQEKLILKNVIRRFDASHIIIKSKKC